MKSIRKFRLSTRLALDRYLFERVKVFGAVFGLTNVALVLGSLWYVFFILPKSAAEQARSTVSQQIREQLQDQVRALTTNAVTLVNEVGQASGESKYRLKILEGEMQSQAERMRKKVADLEKDVTIQTGVVQKLTDEKIAELDGKVKKAAASVGDLTSDRAVQAAGVVKQLTELKDVGTIPAQLTKLSEELTALKKDTVTLRKDANTLAALIVEVSKLKSAQADDDFTLPHVKVFEREPPDRMRFLEEKAGSARQYLLEHGIVIPPPATPATPAKTATPTEASKQSKERGSGLTPFRLSP